MHNPIILEAEALPDGEGLRVLFYKPFEGERGVRFNAPPREPRRGVIIPRRWLEEHVEPYLAPTVTTPERFADVAVVEMGHALRWNRPGRGVYHPRFKEMPPDYKPLVVSAGELWEFCEDETAIYKGLL